MIEITPEKLEKLLEHAPDHLRYKGPITAFDVETPNTNADRICSVGITLIDREKVTESFEILVKPDTYFDSFCIGIHGITPEMVADAPEFPEVWERIRPCFYGRLVIAHNAGFDLHVLKQLFAHYGIEAEDMRYADTLQISRAVFGKRMPNHKLGTLCCQLGIGLDAHKAGSDSCGCGEVYLRALQEAGDLSRFEKVYRFC